jgi:hypothetical protein
MRGKSKLPKAVTAKPADPAGEKKKAVGAKAARHQKPLNLEQFRESPVKAATPLLLLRSRDKIAPVLTSPDFAAGIEKLALLAAAEPRAAIVLSKFAVRPEFSSAVVEPMKASGRWPAPSKFEDSADRQRAADALALLRPSWAASWLAQALVGTQARYTKLRHFFASRLILAAGGLTEAAEALGRDLLLDEKIIDLVAASDADAGAKLRADAAGMRLEIAVSSTALVHEPLKPQETVPLDQAAIMNEAAWSDADEALGRALRDMGFMARSFEQLESAVDGEAGDRARRAKGASEIVLKWVRQAARQRNIKPLNSVGERVQFDPVYHDLDDASPGDYVRVITPSIVRGDGEQQIVLLRGEVELD